MSCLMITSVISYKSTYFKANINLYDRVNRLRNELEVQKALDRDPSNSILRDEKAVYVQAFNAAKIDEERFLKEKAKIEWLEVGDSNSAYRDGLFLKRVFDLSNDNMTKPVTNEEIKNVMFGIGDDKAPGPNGFTSLFFKKGRDVVGQDVCNAVRDFFINGKLLKEINHTFFALIPNITTPLKVNDYRPISCCNVIYKCISKILTNRIIEGTKEVVSDNQLAFVPGRRISENILITQELMHNYHIDRGPPRRAFKVDIQKAYDMVDWRFLENILKCLGFHPIMTKWIMACVTSTSFLLSINGNIHGYLKKGPEDMDSAKVIMDPLNEFKDVSGLVPSIPKSTAFFCNVLNHVKIGILNIMPFSEGKLPVKYLGVPLISSRLLNKDCKILVEKARNRIEDWKNKSLSFAGRLQLCKSVISSMQVYWASVLVIPKGIICDIQQLIRCFLWCNGEYKRGKAKVAWEDICLPKHEGGLGLCNLEVFNRALMTTHIWNIVSNRESLWVRWIHTYKLRGGTLWDVQVKGNGMSTSFWYDMWCSQSPISHFLTPRDIARDGFTLQANVADLVENGVWTWPLSWLVKAPNMGLITVPNLDDSQDCVQWRDHNGNMAGFSVKLAWEVLRPRAKVWNLVRTLVEMDTVQPILHDIMLWFQPVASKRTFQVVVGKMLLAATSYFIWRERYNRLFKDSRRPPEEIRDLFMVTVRLKLISFRFKYTPRVQRLLALWKMPSNFRLYGVD
ncbi:hypothetical protein Tco_0398037 [Tanacetum coccineum]